MTTGGSCGKSQVKSSDGSDSGPWSSQGNSDRKKSILKHRDPETEQLLPDISTDSPVRRNKMSTPVKFVGVSDEEDDERMPHKKLPRSPLPSRKPPRAPLADLLADFDGPENSMKVEDIIMNEALLDQQNANTILRCSRQNCKLNSPAQSSSVIQDPLIAPYCMPLCICGAPMTRVPVQPCNDNSPPINSSSNTFASSLPTSTPDQAVSIASSIDYERMKGRGGYSRSVSQSAASASIEKVKNGRNDRSGGRNGKKPENRHLTNNLNNEDDLLFADSTPTEETKLLERSSLPRGSDKTK